jgi:hypothetical protein
MKINKKIWKENNPDKIKIYDIRGKLKVALDEEKRHKLNTRQRHYRKENPEKFSGYYENRKNNIYDKIGFYKHSANKRDLLWELTNDDAFDLFVQPCMFCGMLELEKLNGIDRVKNDLPYTVNNCVSCCKLCNMIKKHHNVYVFIGKIEHILTHLKIISGKINDLIFSNRPNVNYIDYEYHAKRKEVTFNINKDIYNKLTSQNCYLCNKVSTKIHTNGIDRICSDKNIGYITENIASCCGDCNYMKNNYDLITFIKHLYRIYTYQQINPYINIEEKNNYDNEIKNGISKMKTHSGISKNKYEIIIDFLENHINVKAKQVLKKQQQLSKLNELNDTVNFIETFIKNKIIKQVGKKKDNILKYNNLQKEYYSKHEPFISKCTQLSELINFEKIEKDIISSGISVSLKIVNDESDIEYDSDTNSISDSNTDDIADNNIILD